MWIFWIALIVVVIWGAKSLAGGGSGERHRSPLEILEERYARGEIDHDEFERRREDLAGKGGVLPR